MSHRSRIRVGSQPGQMDVHAIFFGNRSDVQGSCFRTGNRSLLLVILKPLSCEVCTSSLRNLEDNGCFYISETRGKLRQTCMTDVLIDLAASKTAFAVEEEVTFWWDRVIDIGWQRQYAATHDSLRARNMDIKIHSITLYKASHSQEWRTAVIGTTRQGNSHRSRGDQTVPGVPLRSRTTCERRLQSKHRPRWLVCPIKALIRE